ncbi:WD40 repeat domain-containing serine/threonine protein kinase [Tengunoibacter tsumagoiensis]|uniref:non-specific serine/threonine protein kinase n=1 Tax=Tengunoibacter tsumagoiensis TaxID=2014871 RepID=A0A402A9Z9_9CHLR|nr:serine/threonine-protein kinase [Tengunoibacter tsumagoiensis]GCE15970.1 hypothetical protein KTT_58290 [Tengunoibacter tsumagoiensis]
MAEQQKGFRQQLGHYILKNLLGSGGFADVYLAEHIHLHTLVAIKVLHTHLANEDIEAFRREAQTVAALSHPHIVRIFDFGVEAGTPYLVMDYAYNGSLRQRFPKGQAVPIGEIVPVLLQVASALHYAHGQRVIHRDIKPENMMLNAKNEVILGDFGIAIVTQTSSKASTQNIAGTVAYMAPEQIQAHPVPASDQYSLGVVVYEWLCGQRPFEGSYTEIAIKHSVSPPPPLRNLMPSIPDAVEQVVMTALHKDPQQRFPTVLDFAQAFAQAVFTHPQQQPTMVKPGYGYLSPPVAQQPFYSQPPMKQAAQFYGQPPMKQATQFYGQPPVNQATQFYNPSPVKQVTQSTYLQASVPEGYPHNSVPVTAPKVSRRKLIVGISSIAVVGVGLTAFSVLSNAQILPGDNTNTHSTTTLKNLTGSSSAVGQTVGQGGEQAEQTYTGQTDWIWLVAWSPDGKYVASGSHDGTCHIWQAADGKRVLSVVSNLEPHQSDAYPWSIVWSKHDPKQVAIGFADGSIQILDVTNGQRLLSRDKDVTPVPLMSWSPDGKQMAVSSTDNTIVIYDLPNWNPRVTFREHTDFIKAISWSPDGRYIASGGDDTKIRVWDPQTAETKMVLSGQSQEVTALSWRNDSQRLVSSAQDYIVRIWDIQTVRTLVTHEYTGGAPMGNVAWSPDGKWVAAYPGNASVDILDATTLNVKQTISTGVVYGLSWSPDSMHLATGCYDKVTKLWHIS